MAFIEPMHRNKPNITYLLTDTTWHFAADFRENSNLMESVPLK